ncbi:MAG TPA: S4 domain-containing protein [Candidatus Acidoferrum sp.]|jgi:pseudouridine synthase|nr:S4 domain-containing protein [Candidatus Acidoferrum sp.]
MLERLQKIIARAGIASRRHAEQLILSGQVRVNGQVITELGSKADAKEDRIEAAGKLIEANERRVYIILNKPPEVVSTMADPEGRKTLKNCLKGLPERVYPVGRLDYDASGLVFLTNDGDLAAEMLKDWANLQQHYHVKIKGRLMMGDLERLGRNASATIRTVRQPDATRGHAENFWYEVALQDSKKDILRRVLFAEKHPVEKLKRIALGPFTLEGLPQGRYRLLIDKEVDELRRALKIIPKPRVSYTPPQESVTQNDATVIHAAPEPPANKYFEKRRPENKYRRAAANRPVHRKHGPRPSRPPSTQDREGYPNQESASDRPPTDRRPKWGQNQGSRSQENRSEQRPSHRSGSGRPSSPGRPAKWNQNRPSQHTGPRTPGSGPHRPSSPGRPTKWNQNRPSQHTGSRTEGPGPHRPASPGRPAKWNQNRPPQYGGPRSEGSTPHRPSSRGRPTNSYKGKNPRKPFRPNPHLRPQ